MSSWLTCPCGGLIHTNLFCGTNIGLIISEEFLDTSREGKTLEPFVTEMIVSSPKLLTCKSCGRLVILRYQNGQPVITTYVEESL